MEFSFERYIKRVFLTTVKLKAYLDGTRDIQMRVKHIFGISKNKLYKMV